MKKCPSCKNQLPKEDFLLSKICYRCVYADKLRRNIHLIKNKVVVEGCVICSKKLKRNRRKYCSEECAFIAKIKKDKESWHKNVNVQKSNFKV